jgi:MFS family permease
VAAETLDRLLAGSPLRRPRVARRILLALGCVLLLSVLVILLTVGSMSPEAVRAFALGLALSALLSTVPILILRYLDRRERESPWLFAIAILWGALIATGLALPLNTGIIVGVDHWLARHAEIAEYLGPQGAVLVGAPLAAPLVEETTKALGVVLLFLLLRAEFDNVRDGFVRVHTTIQNLIIFLPFVILLFVTLRRSGRWERRVIAEELADEIGGAVTTQEYDAIRHDGIFRTRRVDRMDRRRSAALVNAQHELAFRKWRVRCDGADPSTDPLVAGWRHEIAVMRA